MKLSILYALGISASVVSASPKQEHSMDVLKRDANVPSTWGWCGSTTWVSQPSAFLNYLLTYTVVPKRAGLQEGR
jgi:hypothetical protein